MFHLNAPTKFCVFNTCDTHHKDINLGPGFVPFSFISNEFLVNSGAVCFEMDNNLPKNARHHYGKDVTMLVDYLVKFINDSNV